MKLSKVEFMSIHHHIGRMSWFNYCISPRKLIFPEQFPSRYLPLLKFHLERWTAHELRTARTIFALTGIPSLIKSGPCIIPHQKQLIRRANYDVVTGPLLVGGELRSSHNKVRRIRDFVVVMSAKQPLSQKLFWLAVTSDLVLNGTSLGW